MSDRSIAVRRVYDPAEEPGTRILVDRLWPRGLRKDSAHVTRWAKELAPSTELRRWYGHDPDKFDEFRRRYRDELGNPDARRVLRELRALADDEPLTLVTATKDLDRSNAAVLAELLREMP